MALIIVIESKDRPDADVELFYKYVSADRRKKIQSYLYEEDAYRSLLGGLLVRHMLCTYLDMDNSELVFGQDQNGKPYLLGAENCYFNISHSKNRVVCILDSFPVGIDVEKMTDIDIDEVSVCLHCGEYRDINVLAKEEKKRYFYKVWTVKEAYLKMRGTGLLRPLSSFYVGGNNDDEVYITDSFYCDCDNLTCESIELEDYYMLSYVGRSKADIIYMSDDKLFRSVEKNF